MGFSKITILLLFLPAVFAVPHQPRHGHRSGTAHHSTATYHAGNATSYGPTGSGTGTGVYAYSTVTVVPLSATDSSATLPTFISVSISSSLSESSIVEALTSGSTSPCSSPTVTITSSGLVTITVTSSDSAAAGQSTSSQIDLTNSTSSLPSSFVYQSIGTTDTSETTSSAVPSYSASSYVTQSSDTSFNAAQSSASIITSSASPKGYSQISLPASSAASSTPVSSQADTVSVSSPISPTTSATGTTAAVVTSSSPYVTAAPVTGGVPGNGKRGLAYAAWSASQLSLFSTATATVPWAWNWEAHKETDFPAGHEYVPMIHDIAATCTSSWDTAASAAAKSGSKHFMSINEPDQAKLQAFDIATMHNKLMNKFSDGKSTFVGSPSVTNGVGQADAGWGLDWLKNFVAECAKIQGGCAVDFVPLHWYRHIDSECLNSNVQGCITDFETWLVDAVTKVKGMYPNAKIWVTEFMPWNASVKDQATFFEAVKVILDNTAEVERYSYFMLAPYDTKYSQYHMIGDNNALNDLGKAYLA